MTTSYLVPVPKAQFFDNNGYPLAGGLLYSYAAGTSTPLATYTDATGNTPNTNPVVLDASGRADIWLGAALYKLTLTTSAGSNIWTEDNIQGNGFFNGVLANYWAGLATGTTNAIILTTNPSVSALIAPIQVSFIAAYTNTGATTVNLDALGVKNLYKQTAAGVVALSGGELIAGNIYNISYDNTQWQLITGVGSAIYWGGTSSGSANVQTANSTPSFTIYNASLQFSFIAGFTNTGSTTININGLGAKNIYKLSNGGPVALQGGEIIAGNTYILIYDGTEFQLQTTIIPQAPFQKSNLKGAWLSNTTATWTANQLVLQNNSQLPQFLNSYSQTLNSATTGAGGLDTGTIANSTWYYVYAIYNPATLTSSILMSLSSTAPTLPSGYTYFVLIGVVRTDSSAHFIGFIQANEKWRYQIGNNLTSYTLITNGSVSGAVSVSAVCPVSITSQILVVLNAFASSNSGINIYSNAAAQAISSFLGNAAGYSSPTLQYGIETIVLLESSNVYVVAQANSASWIYGFDINF